MANSPISRDPIPWAQPNFWGLEKQYVSEALDSTWISGGPFVDRLEAAIAAFTASPFAVSASNGTTAIHLAYLALNLQPGDEVIVPGFAFQACANIAILLGLKPVFCEVDAETWCMNAKFVERCITPRTRLIAAVHCYGNLCDMDSLLELSSDTAVPLFEDAAEAFGTTWRGRQAGALGPIGSFSFQATKTISTGEGGMVLTRNPEWCERMRLFRSHGMNKRRYWHEVPGHNFRLTNLQAALGCAQFESLPRIMNERKRVHKMYMQCLNGGHGLRLQQFLPQVDAVLWAMAVFLEPAAYPQGRDEVMQQLATNNIETRPGFYCPSDMPMYLTSGLPTCAKLSRQIISLPTYPTLTNDQIVFICETLKGLRR